MYNYRKTLCTLACIGIYMYIGFHTGFFVWKDEDFQKCIMHKYRKSYVNSHVLVYMHIGFHTGFSKMYQIHVHVCQ